MKRLRSKPLYFGLLSILLSCLLITQSSYSAFAAEETEIETSTPAETSSVAETTESSLPEEVTSKISNYENQISSLNNQISQLDAENAAIQEKINGIQDDKVKQQAVVASLDEQIYVTQSKISALNERISLLEAQVVEKEEEIAEKEEQYADNYELYLQRLRAMYMYDSSSTLGLVLGADDFVDFLTVTDTISRITQHDQALMEDLLKEQAELEEAKVELEETHKTVAADKVAVVKDQDALSAQKTTAAAAVQSISYMEQEYMDDIAANKAKANQMENQISSIYKQIELSQNPYVGGEMAWPVPGYRTISSVYGWRFSGQDFHTGIDITGGGVMGAPVVAANGGTVKVANWSYSPGSGYGIYVIIDHGGSTTTLYGHLSNITVSVGQEVARGETIGNVGSTGWSTGPHLHFEVRQGSGHVNPAPYIGL